MRKRYKLYLAVIIIISILLINLIWTILPYTSAEIRITHFKFVGQSSNYSLNNPDQVLLIFSLKADIINNEGVKIGRNSLCYANFDIQLKTTSPIGGEYTYIHCDAVGSKPKVIFPFSRDNINLEEVMLILPIGLTQLSFEYYDAIYSENLVLIFISNLDPLNITYSIV